MSGHFQHAGAVRQTREAMGSLFGPDSRSAVTLPELQPLPVTGPGFYAMPAEAYHADPCPEPSLSASFACALVTTTPMHARLKHPRLAPQPVEDEAEHFAIGTAAHAAFLEGRDVVQVLDFKDWRTNDAKAARSAACVAGKIPLLRHVWENVRSMLMTTRAQLDAHEDGGAAMFTDGLAEPVLVWREDDLWFRARLDWLRVAERRGRFAIDDYKTASDANPEYVSSRTAWDHGWHIKASFYRRGILALTGLPAEFRFAVQETFAPYALSVMAPSPGAEMAGDLDVHRAIERWRRGLRDNHWPGYPTRTAFFEVPAWLEKQMADREVNDGV